MTPMKLTAGTIWTSGSRAKVIPTANASMLVATAMGAMTAGDREPSACSASQEKDSRIILPPMSTKSTKATQ